MLAATLALAGAAAEDLAERFEIAVITVEGAAACHRLEAWLALDADQRARGLMYVRELPADQGMLFIYPAERRVSMWMKNTLIPLDMIFIRADGTVANVVADTTPLSVESIHSAGPVRAVLELSGGGAARFGLEPGRRVYLGQAVHGLPR